MRRRACGGGHAVTGTQRGTARRWWHADRWSALTLRLVAALATAVILAVVFLVDPNRPGHYPKCPSLLVTGWSCPGCGSLRALHALLHLRFGEALARNPLAVVAAGWLAVRGARWFGGRRPTRLAAPAVIWSLLALILAFWVLRNIPGVRWLGP